MSALQELDALIQQTNATRNSSFLTPQEAGIAPTQEQADIARQRTGFSRDEIVEQIMQQQGKSKAEAETQADQTIRNIGIQQPDTTEVAQITATPDASQLPDEPITEEERERLEERRGVAARVASLPVGLGGLFERGLQTALGQERRPTEFIKQFGTAAEILEDAEGKDIEEITQDLIGQGLTQNQAEQAILSTIDAIQESPDRQGGINTASQVLSQQVAPALVGIGAGAGVGSAAGTAARAILPKAASTAGRLATGGAALGTEGAVGGTVTRAALGDDVDTGTAAFDAGVGIALPAGIKATLRGAQRVAAPFRESAQEAVENVEALKQAGIEDIPLSAQTTSPFLRFMETSLAQGVFGRNLSQRAVNASNKAQELAQNIGRAGDEQATGEIVQTGFENFRKGFDEMASAIYEKIPNELPASAVNLDNVTTSIIDDLKTARLPGSNKEIKFFDQIRSNFFPAINQKPTLKNLRALRSEVLKQIRRAERGGQITTGADIGRLKLLSKALHDDIMQTAQREAPEVAQDLAAANAAYRSGIEQINSTVGRAIAKTENPEALLTKILRPNSAENIEQLYALAGKENADIIRSGMLAKLIREATTNDKVTGARIAGLFKKYGERTLQAAVGKDGVDALKTAQKTLNALEAGKKVAQGSQTAFISAADGIAGLAGAGVGASLAQPQILLPVAGFIGGKALLTKMLSTDFGQRLLTQGYDPATLRFMVNAVDKLSSAAAPAVAAADE